MTRLGVNVDHVATLRQARRADEPDPVWAANLAELGGADGIIVHLREDRRHIQDRDLRILGQTVASRLNLEMAATDEMVAIALDVKPAVVTLVPERRQEVTTEGGLNVAGNEASLRAAIRCLQEGGLPVMLFIDPDPPQIEAARRVGANGVELHTGEYARQPDRPASLDALRAGADQAQRAGLMVAAGHGLTYRNVRPVAAIGRVEELNIGHSIVSRAVLVGLVRAVREMKALIDTVGKE